MSQARPQPAWARFAPGLDVLLHYDRTWLRGDLLAGLTVAAYLIPQVMAYAEIARLPAITGLWAILCPLALYALLGSSRQLSVGPESTTALMTAAGAGALAGTLGPGRWADVAALLAIGVGLICLIGWVARAGFLANLLSRPVLVGYMAGIAVLMIVSQLGKVTGLKLDGESVGAELWSLARQAGNVHWPTFALALAVLVALFAFRAWAPTWPGPLIGMLAAAGRWPRSGCSVRGSRSSGPCRPACRCPACRTSPTCGCWSWCPTRRASRWWATPTTCSRPGRSPPSTGSGSTPARNCWRSGS